MNKPIIETCLSPSLLHLFSTDDKVVVIIDVFRATSTIATAIDNGALNVIPVDSVQKCIELGNSIKDSITAGERNGAIADGLIYGNSPSTFPKEFIDNKILILTTTNGTRLLHMINGSFAIITGSFVNIDAVCEYLINEKRDVLLACASWKDRVNLEDSLFAGAVANRLKKHFTIECDSTHMCMSIDSVAKKNYFNYLKRGAHYTRLSKFNLEYDMKYCTTLNVHPVVPIYKCDSLVKL